MGQDPVRRSLESVFSHRPNLLWFCGANGVVVLDEGKAVEQFLARAQTTDISPSRFFDPVWFRANYRVEGPNAFVSYLRNPAQRLALPSPVFAPRWYSRRYRLPPSVNPLVDFLTHGDERNPHPLIDVAFLKSQSSTWTEGAVALEYLVDPQRFRLIPHPLFDAPWYLDLNPDIAAAAMNPLDHYLHFGHREGRLPNRIFSSKWYKHVHMLFRERSRFDPLTRYVVHGFYDGKPPAPGLHAIRKTSVRLTEHGPEPYVRSLRDGKGLYAALRHRPNVDADRFQGFLHGVVQDHNPAFPVDTVLLRRQRIALMYGHKCASGLILYWWLEQAGLLDSALRFSTWSHSFETFYRQSRDYIDDALTFEPGRYRAYKFVRHPLPRAVSSFTHFLNFPDAFSLSAGISRISFLEFLDLVGSSNFMDGDGHVRPQQGRTEADGLVVPRVLKIEDGLQAHFRSLEAAHALPTVTFDRNPEIRAQLLSHAKQDRCTISAGPGDRVPLRAIPDYTALMTPEAARKVRELYHMDFEAYGYTEEFPMRRRTAPIGRPPAPQGPDSGESPLSLAAE